MPGMLSWLALLRSWALRYVVVRGIRPSCSYAYLVHSDRQIEVRCRGRQVDVMWDSQPPARTLLARMYVYIG